MCGQGEASLPLCHFFVMAKDEKIDIPQEYIRLVMDFDKMRKYLWGLLAYDMLVESIQNARSKLKKNSYVLDGFSYALQIWLMEAIPSIGTLLGQKYQEGITSVRCRNWYGHGKVSYHDITALEAALGQVNIYIKFICLFITFKNRCFYVFFDQK